MMRNTRSRRTFAQYREVRGGSTRNLRAAEGADSSRHRNDFKSKLNPRRIVSFSRGRRDPTGK